MSFVRIDTLAGQYSAEKRAKIDDVLCEAIREIGALETHRSQLHAEHVPAFVFDRDHLESDGFVVINLTLTAGRSLEQKRQLFAKIADGLQARAGTRREDVLVNLIEVGGESFDGRYSRGQLAELP